MFSLRNRLAIKAFFKPTTAAAKYDLVIRIPLRLTAINGAKQIRRAVSMNPDKHIVEVPIVMKNVDPSIDGTGYDELLAQDLGPMLTTQLDRIGRNGVRRLEVEPMQRNANLPEDSALFIVQAFTF